MVDNMAGISPQEQEFLNQLYSRLEDLTEKRASAKVMLYGESGVGKTVAAMQLAQTLAPPNKRIIYVDSGVGWVSLNNHTGLKNRTSLFKVRGLSDFDSLATAIEKGLGSFGEVGAIVIDEYSTFADYDLLAVTKSRAARAGGDKDADEPKQPDMGVSSNRMKRYTGPLIRLTDVHVIFVAHQRTDKDNLSVPIISPAFMPKFNAHLRGLLHLVGYITADEMPLDDEGRQDYKREVQVWPTARVVAKTRIGGYSGVKVSIPEMIYGIREWLGGNRETSETDVIHKDPAVPTSNNQTDEVDDLINSLEGE